MSTKIHSTLTGADLHVCKVHGTSHTNGTDNMQLATSTQNGVATAAQIGKLDDIEELADVTDAANVNTAGAVMETDFGAQTVALAVVDNTPLPVTIPQANMVGRISGGNVGAVTASQVRSIINVEDGADITANNAPQAHENTHESGGIDEIEFDSLAEGVTYKKFLATERTKLTGIDTSADVTDATTVAAAGAVMDSDISETEGLVRKTGSGAYEALKTNLNATTAPTANEDSDDGYAVGSRWIDTTANKEYVCLDSAVGAAVWTETTGSGSGSGDMLKSTYDPNTDGIIAVAQTEADVTDATSVAAAGAIMDSDFSMVEGFLRKTGSGAYEAIRSNMSTAASPTTNDDGSIGFAIGSRWLDTTADKEYICLDHTIGAAVWKETTGSGSGIADIVEDSTPQLGGDLDLNGHEILVDTTPGTDHTASGMKGTFTNGNGGAVAFGDVCFMAADGHLEFAGAEASTTMPGLYMALGSISAAASGEWLIMGVARDDTWNWTIGAGIAGLIYVSLTGTSANTLTQTKPSTTGDQVQIVGTAISADTMMFNPSPVIVEIA